MAAPLRKNLVHRLITLALPCAVLLAGIAICIQLGLQTQASRTALDTEARQLLLMLQDRARAQLQGHNDTADWSSLLRHPEIHAIHLSDHSDHLLSSHRRPLIWDQYRWLPDLLLGQTRRLSLPLQEDDLTLGHLSLELDTAIAGRTLLECALKTGLTTLLAVLACAGALLLLSHRMITRPLGQLAGQLQHLNPEHPASRLLPRPAEHADDELGLWVDRTNQLISCVELSERRRLAAEQRLTSLARVDQLTGLPNRSLLQQQFAQLLHDAMSSRSRLAVLCFDLDDFQAINERHGYDAGDHLLGLLAVRLRSLDGRIGCVGRLGADQFCLIQPGVQHPGDAADLACELARLLAEPFRAGAQSITLKASTGIALYPEDGHEPEVLLQRAEQSMTLAKQTARSGYRFYVASIDQQIREQREMEHDLRLALRNGELELHYQPQVRLQDLQVCGAEVLLRWRHPQRGLVMPDQFIPLAERSELIGEISDWILEQSCRQLQLWQARGLHLRLAINLSTRQLHNQQLPGRMRQLLEQYRLRPQCIELEITETGLMKDIDCAARQLYSLRQSGVLLALDDFGTGYSSLGYLRTLPLDKLKIDKSFIRDMVARHSDASIVLAIIQLARNLGLSVLAEGVEDAAQEASLLQVGCQEAQGYRYGRPMPAGEFEQYLQQHRSNPASELHAGWTSVHQPQPDQ